MVSRGLILLVSGLAIVSALTPNTFLEDADKKRFLETLALQGPFLEKDISNLAYSVFGLTALNNGVLNIPEKDKQGLCSLSKTIISNGGNLENVFFASLTAKALNCVPTPPASTINFLEGTIKDGASVSELHRAGVSLLSLGKSIDSPRVAKLLTDALKNDDSLLSSGLAFQLGARLTCATCLAPLHEKIGDVIIQADEVDGKYLQFEGGLGVTAQVVMGIFSLSAAANKPTGLTNDHVVKLTNYFLNRKSVQSPKGVTELVSVLNVLAENKYHVPVCVSVFGRTNLNPGMPVVSVRVTNVLGKSLGPVAVTAESSAWTGKKTLQNVAGDSTLFALNFLENKPRRGSYDITLTVTPSKADPRLIGTTGAVVKVTVLTEVEVSNAEISVVDRDQATAIKSKALRHPATLDLKNEIVDADYQQKLLLKFTLKDKSANDGILAHQVFVQLVNEETKQEIVFVAEPESVTATNGAYKFELNVATRAKDFGHSSGKYIVSLIVGDSVISNPFNWKIGAVKLTFPSTSSENLHKGVPKSQAPWLKAVYEKKDEIVHLFRTPEKRPAQVVSDAFSILVLAPLIVLFGLWAKIGINFGNLQLSLSALIFHSSVAAIFSLYALFWLRLNMFTTVKCLLGLAVVAFLSGHSLLKKLASDREKRESAK